MSDDRKTPEQRATMSDIERLRHSAAHVLATAILKIWPEAQFAAGPPVENGFYYDVELPHRISPDDFAQIEAEMKKETKANHTFERVVVNRGEALALAEAGELGGLGPRPAASKFKLDIIQNIPEGEEISLYRNGEFTDLCAGPHVMRTGNIGAFKLTHVASAYYKGDEKNPQLQRIYGTAFKNKTQLDEYFAMLEEAKKRDHRKLGKELELFTFDDDVGPGLPLWLPRGTAIIEELEKLAKETEFAAGYVRVRTPNLARESLYKTSGHLPYYADSMFPPMELNEDAPEIAALEARIEQAKAILDEHLEAHGSDIYQPISGDVQFEQAISAVVEAGDVPKDVLEAFEEKNRCQTRLVFLNQQPRRYYLKAMNCPHHHKLYDALPRSYRDLPLRLAEYGTCHRYEQSGELFGLMRVRSLQMNDAHIYCTADQFESEFRAVNEMYLKYFKLFGIEKYVMRFSTHDPARLGQKFVDEPRSGSKPKTWSAAFSSAPASTTSKCRTKPPSTARRSTSRSGARSAASSPSPLTRSTSRSPNASALPTKPATTPTRCRSASTAPRSARTSVSSASSSSITPATSRSGYRPSRSASSRSATKSRSSNTPAPFNKSYARSGVRAELDASNDHIKAKIANAEQMKVHTMLVIGGRDMEANAVSVRVHGQGNLGAKPRDEVVAELLASIHERQ